MEPILEAKKGKSNLAVGSEMYYHDKVISLYCNNK